MAKRFITKQNSPAPFNVAGAANAVGCSQHTLRNYLRDGLLDGVQKTPGGHVILFEPQVEQAREIFERNKRVRGTA